MIPLAPLFRLLSPSGQKARLSVLILHRILSGPDPLFPGEPDARWFDQMLTWMKAWFNVMPLDEAVVRLEDGSLPARAAAITFDDGYADNFHLALPILRKHGLNATVFVANGFLDGGIMWNDAIIEMVRSAPSDKLDLTQLGMGEFELSSTEHKRASIDSLIAKIKYLDIDTRMGMIEQCIAQLGVRLPSTLMMTADDVRGMRQAGMVIGAHTTRHPILTRISPECARQEIVGSKSALEEILQEPVTLFAYPNGRPGADYGPEHVAMVRDAGFSAAMSTVWGAADGTQDLFQIPRFMPWDRTQMKFGLRLARNLIQANTSTV